MINKRNFVSPPKGHFDRSRLINRSGIEHMLRRVTGVSKVSHHDIQSWKHSYAVVVPLAFPAWSYCYDYRDSWQSASKYFGSLPHNWLDATEHTLNANGLKSNHWLDFISVVQITVWFDCSQLLYLALLERLRQSDDFIHAKGLASPHTWGKFIKWPRYKETTLLH